MKRMNLLFTLLLSSVIGSLTARAQFPNGNAVYSAPSFVTLNQGAVSFVIGNKAYTGTGNTYDPQEFWEFDAYNNVWTRKADFPGADRLRAVAFSIGGKGYIGSGQLLAGGVAADFWEYDPATDTWTQKASIPTGRRSAVGFSIGNKGYVGTGTTASAVFTTDLWEFDPAANTWTQKADFPGTPRRGAAGFAVGGKGYLGTGMINGNIGVKDFWEYDPAANSWAQKTDFPGTARFAAVGAANSTRGYIGTGNIPGTWYGDVHEYNPATNAWTTRGFVGTRTDATGFVINNMIHIGLGFNSNWLPDFKRISPYYEVRNFAGDYDEQAMSNSPTCFQYAMPYNGSWSGFIESYPDGYSNFASFQVNSTQNLGKICYKSRVDAGPSLRTGNGWFGGSGQQQLLFSRRNYQISFENLPVTPVGFRLYYTKEELDYLIYSYNTTYGKNKTYSDLRIIKYNGPNIDLDPANNSGNNSDYEQITPTFTYYGNTGQYVYTEFNVSSYSEFYMTIGDNAFFVNDNNQSGDVYTSAVGAPGNPGTVSAPFATLTEAVAAAQNGDMIYVDAGQYAERVIVNKQVYLKGAYAGTNPGSSLSRGASETQLIPSTENNLLEILTVQSPNVTIDGFLFDGDNPALTGSITLNGVDVNAGMAINNGNLQTDNLVIKNNIIKNFYRYGVLVQKLSAPVTTGNKLFQNRVDNISSRTGRDGRALCFFANAYGSMTYNHLTRVHSGLFVVNHNTGTTTDSLLLANNTIEAYNAAINTSFVQNQTSSYRILNNQLSLADLSTWSAPGSSTVNNATGISMGVINSTKVIALDNNIITGFRNGIFPNSINTPEGIRINGGSVSNGTGTAIFYIGGDPATAKLTLSNITLQNNDVAVDVSATDATNMPVEFSGVTAIGGANGLRVYSPKVILPGNVLSGISFAGQSNHYIQLTYNAFSGLDIDATSVTFEGLTGANMTLAQRFNVENKIIHRVDYNGGGFIRIKAKEAYVTPTSFISTFPVSWGTPTTTPDINRAVASVAAGDTIHVDAGTYNGQVTLDKGLTIRGAGKDLTYLAPSGAAIVPPPGPFTETGLIQTAQNIGDVYISDLTATGNDNLQCIIIQSGGSVKNCRLLSGGQGVYFRVASATKTALIENNEINVPYIGVNCQGSGLTATLLNNEITPTNPGFSSGVFYGLDFGPLPQFTATGNKIINNTFAAFFGGANNNSITQNSIVGPGLAIQKTSGNTIQATCNWYGSSDVNAIAAKMNGSIINYSPWLVSGTDTDPATIGFQPAPGTCTGRQNRFFVNDNSQTGDALTTAVGNNSNNGLFTSPYATIQHAITQAQNGDTIFVDAGTYIENVNVNKSLTLRGVKYGQQPGSSLDRGNETIILPAVNNTGLAGLVRTTANNITIDGFTVDGDNPAIGGGVIVNGVDVNAGAGIFNDNVFINNLTVINNIVKNTSSYGIGQFKALGNTTAPAVYGALFRNNRVHNIGARGLVLAWNAYGSILNNQTSQVNTSGVWIANSTLPNPAGSPVQVRGNIIEANVLGMQASAVHTNAPRVEFLENEVTVPGGTAYGISIIGGTTSGVTVFNNKVMGGLSSILSSVTTAVSPVFIINNSFTGYTSRSFETNNSLLINGGCNWFGTASRAAIEASVLGNVNYTPWLINGTDADPAVGFQPVANSCLGQPKYYVNDNSQSGDVFTTAVGNNSNNGSSSSPFLTIDYAYSVAQPGDTIYVDAGTYNMGGLTYSFPKAVTLLGTNYQVSPNDPANKSLLNTARNAESILMNGKASIASSGLSIEGFTWDVGNRTGVELVNTAVTNNDFGNFKFTKNIYKISHTTLGINSFFIVGKFVSSPSLPVTSGYTITDNRFEKSGTTNGSTLNFNYVKNIQVDNNAFVVTGTTFRTQQALNIAASGLVDAVTFTNNLVEQASTAVGGNRIAGATITGNTMRNLSNAFSSTNPMPESSSIEFSNNTMGNDLGTPFILYNRTGSGSSNLFKVENNTVTGVSVAGTNQLFGTMNLTFANTAQNPSFIIRGNKINYTGDFSAVESQFFRPVTVRGNIASVMIENNEITVNNTGGLAGVNPATLLPANPAISVITDNGPAGFMPSNAVINVVNNKIQGYRQSVVVYDVANHPANPYTGYGNIPEGAIVNIHNNSFEADSISINNGTTGETVNASCNWYGVSAAQSVALKISGTVDHTPWLIDGTDDDPATGFQPVPGTCIGTPVVVTLAQATNVTCFDEGNGSISVDVTGGVLPYSFAWTKDNAPYSTIEDLPNLSPGVYVLTITDAVGTTASLAPVTITQPALLTAVATGYSTTCLNSAKVVAAGGTIPYSYLWSNGATTDSISSIPAGTYMVTVTDANSCTATTSVTVTASEAFNPSAQVTDVSCYGGNDGTMTVTNVNATPPFLYSIDGGLNYQSSNVFTGLSAGNYTITVKDANGCTGFVTKTVAQPPQIIVSLVSTQNTCYGQNAGAISVNVTGGSPGFTYNWTGPNSYSSTQRNISGLAAGTYHFTATDSKGCIATLAGVLITTTPQILADSVVTNIACKGETNGSISLNPTGGSGGNFTYLWNTGATTNSITGLGVGNYSVVITDGGNGCSISRSFTITQPATAVSISTTKTNATGCAALGTITVTGSGGTPGYQYQLNNGGYFSANTFTGLYAGNYTVWVRDSKGCTKSTVVSITDNGSDEHEGNNSKNQARQIGLSANINGRIALGSDVADWFKFTTTSAGNYLVTFNHPTASFIFRVYPAGNNAPALTPLDSTSSTKRFSLAANTTYYVSITGGLSYVCYTLRVDPVATPSNYFVKEKEQTEVISQLVASAFPNPHRGSFRVQFKAPVAGTAKVELFTVNGQKLAERNVVAAKDETRYLDFTNFPQGTILYRVTMGKEMVSGKLIGAQ